MEKVLGENVKVVDRKLSLFPLSSEFSTFPHCRASSSQSLKHPFSVYSHDLYIYWSNHRCGLTGVHQRGSSRSCPRKSLISGNFNEVNNTKELYIDTTLYSRLNVLLMNPWTKHQQTKRGKDVGWPMPTPKRWVLSSLAKCNSVWICLKPSTMLLLGQKAKEVKIWSCHQWVSTRLYCWPISDLTDAPRSKLVNS